MSNKNISHIIADTIVEFDKDFAYEDAFELAIQIGDKLKIDVDRDADTLCPVEPEVSVPKKLLKEASYLLHVNSPKGCPHWVEGIGDCGNCPACRAFKCIDNLEEYGSR